MGIIFSRFRKKKTTLEVLEKLEKDIRSIEEFHRSTEQQHRKVMGHLMLYAVGLYILVAFFFYFFFFPATLHEQILYLLPLLIMPILFIFVRRVVTWYYRRKLTRNEGKLKDMKDQKKQLLEDVMDKETYKVARQILEKFAPDQLRKGTGNSPAMPFSRASVENSLMQSGKSAMVPSSVSPRGRLVPAGSELRRRPISFTGSPPSSVPGSVSPVNRVSGSPPMMPMAPRLSGPMALPLPRPILERDRTVMDRLVEYLVGDGPSNRYALICQKCASHNGMALKEEFEYFAFRCCYCHFYNPARKQRPHAPRLEAPTPPSTSTSEAESPPTSSEEEESANKSQDPANALSQPAPQQRGSVDSGSGGDENRSSPKPTDINSPSEEAPTLGNPFDSSEEDEDGGGDTLTSSTQQVSPTVISSPPTEGVPVVPIATSTPTNAGAE